MLIIYLAALDSDEEKIKMTDIYEQYKTVMLRYAKAILQNTELAEDAVHNAFLAIIKHKDKFFTLSHKELRTQVVIITKNKCIDLLRKNSAFTTDSIEDMDDVLVANDDPIEEHLIQSEKYESIKKHVASLDETSRLVLEMKYILGMTYREIGEELNITAKHVDTRIMRAKEKVRKLIMKEGCADELRY